MRAWWASFINCVSSHYPSVFLAVFLVALLLPLRDFTGNIPEFETKFWGYKQLHKGYAMVRQHLFGDIYFENALVSQNGWLIWASPASLDDYQNADPFTDEELAEIQANLDRINGQLEKQGVTFLVVVAPNKNTIYPEYVPSQVPVLNSHSRLDQLLDYQRQHGKAKILDLRPALLEEKKARQVFHATDTHWNAYGALAATREMILALEGDYPFLRSDILEDYEKGDSRQQLGDIGNLFIPGASPEEWLILDLKNAPEVKEYAFANGTPKVSMMVNTETNLPRITVYHDSFFVPLKRFLAVHFSKATYVWSYQVDPVFTMGEKDDIVILEITERFLSALLTDPEPIKD